MTDEAKLCRGNTFRTEGQGYRTQWKNDGTDYPAILESFKAGLLSSRSLSTGSKYRQVHHVQWSDRQFVIKRDWETDSRLEKRLWVRLAGTPYQRLFKQTNRAVNRGCRLVQDVYLIEEKMIGPHCQEAWMIAEYVEGECFVTEYVDGRPGTVGDFVPWIPCMVETMGLIHQWGLASNDFHPGNFVLTSDGLRLIDLSLDSPLVICQANDAWTVKYFFNVELPAGNIWSKVVFFLMFWRRRLKNFLRKIRRSVGRS